MIEYICYNPEEIVANMTDEELQALMDDCFADEAAAIEW